MFCTIIFIQESVPDNKLLLIWDFQIAPHKNNKLHASYVMGVLQTKSPAIYPIIISTDFL